MLSSSLAALRALVALSTVCATVCAACATGGDDPPVNAADLTAGSPAAELEAARAKLGERLAAAGGSYQYEVHAPGTRTTLIAQSGRIAQRIVQDVVIDGRGTSQLANRRWDGGPTLGTIPGYAPPRPIEELYEQCKTEILPQPSASVERDADGLLRSCKGSSHEIRIDALQTFDLAKPIATLSQRIATGAGDYEYVLATNSWLGVYAETTITFRANAPFRRKFVRWDDQGDVESEWVEEGPTLGSHPGGHRAAPLLDVYLTCRDQVLTTDLKTSALVLDLAFDAEGILQSCRFEDHDCVHGCTRGVSLPSVQFGR